MDNMYYFREDFPITGTEDKKKDNKTETTEVKVKKEESNYDHCFG